MGYKFNPFTGNFDIASGSTYSALNLKGTVANAAALPGGAAAGDVYQTEDNDHFYVWDGSAWDDLGDLKGPAGANGINGTNGTNGKEIELQVGATHIEWRYVGDPTWTNLVALSTITGPQGPAGSNGQNIELQTSATHIQWRVVGASTWTDLIALTAITGPQGPTGATGAQGIPGPGVPTGGTTGQVLTKSSATDYAAQWSTPTGTDLSYTASTRLLESSTGADITLPLVTSTNAGLAPASGGGTTNFLRADGTWAAPAGGGGGGSTNASDLTSGTLNDARLSEKVMAAVNTSLWTSFR